MTELQVIKAKLRERMNQIADDLALGTAKDYSDYKYLTGVISGLALIERDILDLEEAQKDID